jgi:hypothetical protein
MIAMANARRNVFRLRMSLAGIGAPPPLRAKKIAPTIMNSAPEDTSKFNTVALAAICML